MKAMNPDLTICSLLPSATEIVFALGRGDRLVAVTHECDFPAEAAGLPVITRSTLDHGTHGSREIHNHIAGAMHAGSSIYALDQTLLERLNPDVILAQELCDVCAVSYDAVLAAVRRLDGPRTLLSLEPTSLGSILETIERVGDAVRAPERAAAVVEQLRRRIDETAALVTAASSRPRVFAMEWLDPPFTAGHWMPEMIRVAGGRDDLAQEGRPSSQVTWDRIVEYDPEIVVLMPCGFSLERTMEEYAHITLPDAWQRLSAVRAGRVYAVDGSAYFNRPGPRIVDGLRILGEIIHPACVVPTLSAAWRRVAGRPAQ